MSLQDNIIKKFFLQTLGCKVNQYETQAIRESLMRAGLEEADEKELADVYIINTCTVTDKADSQSRHMVGSFRKANPNARIVVTGCYAEKDAGDIASIPGVTHIVKNALKARIAEIAIECKPRTVPAGMAAGAAPFGITGFRGHAKAFVKIQDGCENACAYCKVPLVRGPLRSRPVAEIVDEVGGLVRGGYREIVLTGICLGSWGRDFFPQEMASSMGLSGASLVDVLEAIDAIDGDFRIRLSSIEPKYVTGELIDFMASNARVCRHLHMPLQSGDDDILRKMRRPYTSADFRVLVEKARSGIRDVAITTDILICFPGETAVNFVNSVEFLRDISPARTHIFTFSRRLGTPAYDMPGEIDAYVAKKRYHDMEGAALNASYLFRRSFIGRRLDILVETSRDKDSGLLTGYSDNYIDVLFSGDDALMGRTVPVRITQTDPVVTMGVHEAG